MMRLLAFAALALRPASAQPPSSVAADRDHCLLSVRQLRKDRAFNEVDEFVASDKDVTTAIDQLWQGDEDCDAYMGTVGCAWSLDWNCPGQSGGFGSASPDQSHGYDCCCKRELWRQAENATDLQGTQNTEDCDEYMNTEGCGWTLDWNCPLQTGGHGKASRDNSHGYDCCCKRGLWRNATYEPAPEAETEDECPDYMSEVGCGWTLDWNCPGQTGGRGKASRDNSNGYHCCCNRELWRWHGIFGR